MTTQDDGRAAAGTPDGARPGTERRPARLTSGGSGGRPDVLRLLVTEGVATVAALADRTGLHENTVRSHLDRLVQDGLAAREVEVRTVRGRPRHVYRAALPAGGAGAAGGRGDGPGLDPLAPGPARGLDEAAARAGLTRVLLAGYGAAEADVVATARDAGERMLDTLPGAPRAGGPGSARPGSARPGSAGPGSRADQLRELTAHLDRLGFDPVPADDPPDDPPGDDAGGSVVRLWRCPFLDLARARPEVVCAVHLGLARGLLERVGGPLRADRLVPFAGPRHCDLHLAATA